MEEERGSRSALSRPRPEVMQAQLERLARYKDARSAREVSVALDALARSANDENANVYEKVVGAAVAGATHGEICATLREEMGFGEPLVQV